MITYKEMNLLQLQTERFKAKEILKYLRTEVSSFEVQEKSIQVYIDIKMKKIYEDMKIE